MAIRSSPLLLLLLLLLLIVFADAVALSVADPDPPSSSAPAPSPWMDPVSRKLGRQEFVVPSPGVVHVSSSSAIDWNGEATIVTRAQSKDSHLLHHHHKKVDRSVAGGGVILGGLGTTFLVAVFCYIRATRRHKAETTDAPA